MSSLASTMRAVARFANASTGLSLSPKDFDLGTSFEARVCTGAGLASASGAADRIYNKQGLFD